MRIIIYGVGAVGGTVAALLARAGQEVVGIARGTQLAAIRAGGLTLRTPAGAFAVRFTCHAAPAKIAFRPDDAILLCMKTQDTGAALAELRAAGVREQPIFCAQNGVENERLALRLFPNVHGVTVMLPAQFLTPGEVAAFGTPHVGFFDLGRFPGGVDAADTTLAAALTAASLPAFPLPDVMASKYGKLLMNLGNIVEAAFGPGPDNAAITARLRAEGQAAFAAAGIVWRDVGAADPRRDALMQMADIDGIARAGGSSTQSLARGTGSIETDYLNGEVALLGRLHGVATPLNAWFTTLAARMAREGLAPGTIDRGTVPGD
ncbi:MAG: ketopantoate reductase family protein [Rhodobacteraceae bacterium]|nr:ketopantoate reductase family protein [Paracoccaceae bacterium]